MASSSYMSNFLRPPPAGAVIVVLEGGQPCSGETCCVGRMFDAGLQKPSFCELSNNEWAHFTTQMALKVKSYRPEGFATLGLALTMVGLFVFHPSIGPVGRGFENFGLAMALMTATVFGGIIGMAVGSSTLRRANQKVDEEIRELCRQTSTASTIFELRAVWTEPCKPKGARTYRALVIAPASGFPAAAAAAGMAGPGIVTGALMPSAGVVTSSTVQGLPVATATLAQPTTNPSVAVTCPPDAGPGQSIRITVSGQAMDVVVPPGVSPGQQFMVAVPSVPIVEAVAVPV